MQMALAKRNATPNAVAVLRASLSAEIAEVDSLMALVATTTSGSVPVF